MILKGGEIFWLTARSHGIAAENLPCALASWGEVHDLSTEAQERRGGYCSLV